MRDEWKAVEGIGAHFPADGGKPRRCKMVGVPGIEPGSRADLALAGYKAAALPLSYTPAGYRSVEDGGIRGPSGRVWRTSLLMGGS